MMRACTGARMTSSRRRLPSAVWLLLLLLSVAVVPARFAGPAGPSARGARGHEPSHPGARQNIAWLLGDAASPTSPSWADQYLEGNNQTSFWHYVNIPPDATGYDRDRDCPRQPGVAAAAATTAGATASSIASSTARSAWRIASLDRADRAVALKFLVHFVGDLHQPFHALGVERGGNGIPVSVFGSPNCTLRRRQPYAVQPARGLGHVAVAHRQLSDRQYRAALEKQIKHRGHGRRTRQRLGPGGMGDGVACAGEGGAAAARRRRRRRVLPRADSGDR